MAKEPKRPANTSADALSERRYEDIVAELDVIVKRLEAGELPLEESLVVFERGVVLAKAAETRLEQAEAKVEMLLQGDKTVTLASEDAIGE